MQILLTIQKSLQASKIKSLISAHLSFCPLHNPHRYHHTTDRNAASHSYVAIRSDRKNKSIAVSQPQHTGKNQNLSC